MGGVRTILFDADGVIQRPSADFRGACGELLGSSGEPLDAFMRDLFAVEKPSLTGKRDFVEDLMEVLGRHGAAHRLNETLAIWTAIDVDADMASAITVLRKQGVLCCLATNQQPYRGRYMSETLGYAQLFDREFYSHALGLAKPDLAYFQAVAEQLALPPGEILFIDDHESNVLAARDAGLLGAVFPGAAELTSAAALRAILAEHGIALE
jgi:putative hydrolase of the HAD superfamily